MKHSVETGSQYQKIDRTESEDMDELGIDKELMRKARVGFGWVRFSSALMFMLESGLG